MVQRNIPPPSRDINVKMDMECCIPWRRTHGITTQNTTVNTFTAIRGSYLNIK
jgi:hypothetical protein